MQTSPGYRSTALIETTLRVACWNVWWRFGDHWEDRQAAIVSILKEVDADIIALQEVWQDAPECQAQLLAEDLGYSWAYSAPSQIGDIRFGNALLSRWPLESEHRLLPSVVSGDGSRNCGALLARVDGPRGPLAAWSTHLSFRPEESHARQEQVRALCSWVKEVEHSHCPPILCGDFNAIPVSDEIRMLTGKARVPAEGLVFYDAWEAANRREPGYTWEHTNPYTAPALEPDRRLDYIFVGRPLPNGAGHVRRAWRMGTEPVGKVYGSDHYGVCCEIRY